MQNFFFFNYRGYWKKVVFKGKKVIKFWNVFLEKKYFFFKLKKVLYVRLFILMVNIEK